MNIRKAVEADIPALKKVASAVGSHKEEDYFPKCLALQAEDERRIFVAEEEAGLAGYAQLNLKPLYPPFRRFGIPEIQDLNVVPAFRRQGIGRKLVEACEDHARRLEKPEIGIGVGLYTAYGAAQRLYIKMGYLPDGAGVVYDEKVVTAGEMRAVDDYLSLKMLKVL